VKFQIISVLLFSSVQVLSLVTFSGKPNETPMLKDLSAEKFIRSGQLYRYDYDVAIGDDAQMTLTRAMDEIGKVRGGSSYRNGEQFAVWCKTVRCDYSPEEASTLAKARAVERVRTLVQSKNMLVVGDHIAYKPGLVYYQDAVVVAVQDTKLTIVKLPLDFEKDKNVRIMQEIVDVAIYIRKEQLYKYFYEVSKGNSATVVTARAIEKVGIVVQHTPFKDPLHFATWCKTGLYQLHGATEFADL